jgi:hypothetical protein
VSKKATVTKLLTRSNYNKAMALLCDSLMALSKKMIEADFLPAKNGTMSKKLKS